MFRPTIRSVCVFLNVLNHSAVPITTVTGFGKSHPIAAKYAIFFNGLWSYSASESHQQKFRFFDRLFTSFNRIAFYRLLEFFEGAKILPEVMLNGVPVYLIGLTLKLCPAKRHQSALEAIDFTRPVFPDAAQLRESFTRRPNRFIIELQSQT